MDNEDLVRTAIEKLEALASTSDTCVKKVDIFIDYRGGRGIRITLQNTDSFRVEKERRV